MDKVPGPREAMLPCACGEAPGIECKELKFVAETRSKLHSPQGLCKQEPGGEVGGSRGGIGPEFPEQS